VESGLKTRKPAPRLHYSLPTFEKKVVTKWASGLKSGQKIGQNGFLTSAKPLKPTFTKSKVGKKPIFKIKSGLKINTIFPNL
jgi:hypothetical protein